MDELKAVDADHFWIDGVLIDLNQLRHEELVAAEDTKRFSWSQCHAIGQAMGALVLIAKELVRGERVATTEVVHNLRRLNSLGLHTGYVSKEGR